MKFKNCGAILVIVFVEDDENNNDTTKLARGEWLNLQWATPWILDGTAWWQRHEAQQAITLWQVEWTRLCFNKMFCWNKVAFWCSHECVFDTYHTPKNLCRPIKPYSITTEMDFVKTARDWFKYHSKVFKVLTYSPNSHDSNLMENGSKPSSTIYMALLLKSLHHTLMSTGMVFLHWVYIEPSLDLNKWLGLISNS